MKTKSTKVSRRNFCSGIALTGATIAGVTLAGVATAKSAPESITGSQTSINNQNNSSYAEDRALIEDLMARYLFALDYRDLDTYLSTFTEDGILDVGEGEWKGHDTIRKIIEAMPKEKDEESPDLHTPTGRHNVSNIVIKVDGNKATGRAYWFYMSNNNPERTTNLVSHGHYEDEMVKIDGTWYFTKRKIYNEQRAKWVGPDSNPCW